MNTTTPMPGNTDPWAGPVDPQAQARFEARHRATMNSWQAQRDADPCGCWMSDCAECMRKVGSGQRPVRGQRRRFVVAMTVNRARVLAMTGAR